MSDDDDVPGVPRALLDYVGAHAPGDDAFLRELKEAAREAGIPAIWIGPAQACLLQVLLRAAGAREVVEVGTLAGYSAIVMARALPADGRVRTIELDPRHAAFARAQAARSDVAGRVEVLEGAGADVLAGIADESCDALFVDADKAGYPTYLREGLRILRPGGLVLVDNAFAFGRLLDEGCADEDVAAVRAFNDELARTPGLQAVIVPLGDGTWVGVKRGA